ncbi:hypothetical protein [Flavobacterium anhuiense]|uniref:hypothetical protein n=1 Tax=Flavobacterium anhuiense TaxID=459526 RepID=UPI0034D9769C
MTKKGLAELLKYSSPQEIYVITHYNVLKRIFCPFQVLILQEIGELQKGQVAFVTEVKVTLGIKTVFIINNEAYYYSYFDIII